MRTGTSRSRFASRHVSVDSTIATAGGGAYAGAPDDGAMRRRASTRVDIDRQHDDARTAATSAATMRFITFLLEASPMPANMQLHPSWRLRTATERNLSTIVRSAPRTAAATIAS